MGYQTFLYHNECELRQVFMFLIERLPNEGKQAPTNVSSAGKKSLLKQDISNKIEEELKTIWIPPCCKPNSNRIGDFCSTGETGDIPFIPMYINIHCHESLNALEGYPFKCLNCVPHVRSFFQM